MPIVKQKKVKLYALKAGPCKSIMEALQRYGKMHIESARPRRTTKKAGAMPPAFSKEYDKSRVDAIRELKQFDERKSGMLVPQRTRFTFSELEKLYHGRKRAPLVAKADETALKSRWKMSGVQQSSKRIRLDNVIEQHDARG